MTQPLVESLRIAGERVGAQAGGDRAIPVINPYSGALVGLVPKATLAQVRRNLAVAIGAGGDAPAIEALERPGGGVKNAAFSADAPAVRDAVAWARRRR